jgi:hypothetical protein
MCDEFDSSSVAAANDTEQAPSYGVVMTTNTKGGVMKLKGSRRLVARLGLALAVAAIAAPGAQAMTMNATYEGGGGFGVHGLAAANVRTDAASPQSLAPAANVLTDSASSPGQPVSVPAANVRTDSASFQPVSGPSNVQTDAASTITSKPLTDDRHAVLLRYHHYYTPPVQAASGGSSGIDWSVAGFGAALGAIGLMLMFSIVYLTGRHNRDRLAAT